MWLWLLQQLLGAGKCHFISVSTESGGAVASLRMGLDGPKFLGSFFGGGESLLHLLFLLLKSHILRFEAMGLVSSMSILPFWKAPRQCQAPWHGAHVAFPRESWHTRWDPRPAAPAPAPAPPSQGSSGHPSAC